jgi:hypothetical protein
MPELRPGDSVNATYRLAAAVVAHQGAITPIPSMPS